MDRLHAYTQIVRYGYGLGKYSALRSVSVRLADRITDLRIQIMRYVDNVQRRMRRAYQRMLRIVQFTDTVWIAGSDFSTVTAGELRVRYASCVALYADVCACDRRAEFRLSRMKMR